jgi:hypothetical protein
MVNIAFPYKEVDASAMNTALSVLQIMAEKGNKYIRAYHTLLTKIRATIKPKIHIEGSSSNELSVHPQEGVTYPSEQNQYSTSTLVALGSTNDQAQYSNSNMDMIQLCGQKYLIRLELIWTDNGLEWH